MKTFIKNLLTVSTKGSISKLQYSKAKKEDLISYFYAEVKYQNHSTIKKTNDSVSFTVTPFTHKLFRFRNKFNNYSEGKITIKETNEFLIIEFSGYLKNGLYQAMIIPSLLFLFCLFFSIASLNFSILLLPFFIASIFIGGMLFLEIIGIQFYLSNKINRIRENLRDNESIT